MHFLKSIQQAVENTLPNFFEVKRSRTKRLLFSCLLASGCIGTLAFLHHIYDIHLPSLLFFTSSLITIYGELILGLFFSLLLGFIADYFFISPSLSILSTPEDVLRFILFVANQLFLSTVLLSFRTALSRAVSAQQEAERTRENITLSELLLRDAQTVSQVGSWALDLQTWKLIWTEQSYRNFGVKASSFNPSIETLLSLLHPDDRAVMKEWIRACIAGDNPPKFEFRVILSDGRVRILEGQGRQIVDANNKAVRIVGTNRDITESKMIENDLHQSLTRYKLLSDTMVQGIVHQDSMGRVILMNPAAERILGRPQGELLGNSSVEIENICIREDGSSFPGLEHPSMIALKTGKTVVGTIMGVFNLRDQAFRWINISAVPVFHSGESKPYEVYTVFEDITEQKQAKEELERARKTMIEAQKIAHLGSFEYIAATQTTVWSEEEYLIYGLDPTTPSPTYDELLKHCIHPDDSSLLHNSFTLALQNSSSYELEHRIVRPNGEVRWVYDHAHPYFDKKSNLLRYIGITLDITERKQTEKLLKDARDTAEKANHTKDLFLATLSHELRTPLTAILSWAQILRRWQLAPQKVQIGLQTIEEAAHSQNQLISDLLDISRIAVGKIALDLQEIELTEVVSQAIGTVKAAAEKKTIRIYEKLGFEPIFVSGDAVRLQQIIWNLLSNSIKFTPIGGTIEVALNLKTSLAGNQVAICVHDTGKGIPPQILPHIFEQFFQADSSSTRAHGGMGLGLALVDRLVKLHDGTIRVESEGEGKGSTFTVFLPLSRTSAISVRENKPTTDYRHPKMGTQETEHPENHPSLSGIKILLVDDEESTLNSIKEILSIHRAQVRLASSAPEAIAELERQCPDVIVSDIAMPDEDGYSLIQKIRKRGHEKGGNTPAVALTAYADSQTRQSALSAGFQAHISKPVDSDELVLTILNVKHSS